MEELALNLAVPSPLRSNAEWLFYLRTRRFGVAERRMMSEKTFIVKIHYGTIESQSRLVPCGDRFVFEARKIVRSMAGRIESVGDWENVGGWVMLAKDDEPSPWWKFWG